MVRKALQLSTLAFAALLFAAGAFACSAVASLAVACLAWRRLADADAVPIRRGTSPVAAETAANGRSIGPDTLAALQRHSRRRLDVLRQSQQRMQVVIDTNRRVTEQLKRAQRIAGLGSWEWRRRTRRIACSEEVFRLLGLPAEARACRTAEVLDFIHEEDRRAFRRWILQVARRGDAPGLDVRIRTRNGELRYAHILGEAIRQADRVARQPRIELERDSLSLDGRWQEMRDIITEDDLRKLAETCTYDDFPGFVANKREYAAQMGFTMPMETDAQKDRARDVMRQLQAVRTSGVPAGLAL